MTSPPAATDRTQSGSVPGPTGPGWRRALRALPAETRAALRSNDLLLFGAGVTFYGAIAVVPLFVLAVWLLSLVVGVDRVEELAAELVEALPAALGAPEVAGAGVDLGLALSPLAAVFAVLPASLYGEGLRRAYAALADVDDTFVGWRGRLAVLPVLVVAPLLLLAVLAVTPLLNDLFGAGPGPTVLGIYVALNVDWLVLSLPLTWSYRVVAPDPPSWPVAAAGGFATGAFVAGFLQGFALFLSLPIDLGAPFGGSTAVGAVVAVLLWMWVLHLVVLVGYVATRHLQRLLDGR
ncbi:MAG TPA: YhjD/YihY/BrkB family envelope integrity protein [Jiangellales bacterium]|nr:YhjD/YihY/BrkB family envelope integrity protein [Jiangellales bacterium]